jgi:hypothetical protein
MLSLLSLGSAFSAVSTTPEANFKVISDTIKAVVIEF